MHLCEALQQVEPWLPVLAKFSVAISLPAMSGFECQDTDCNRGALASIVQVMRGSLLLTEAIC